MNYKSPSECREDDILCEELFEAIYSEEDEITRARELALYSNQAKKLRIKGSFDLMAKAFQKTLASAKMDGIVGITNFDVSGTEYLNLDCGSWVADEHGVRTYKIQGLERVATKKPMLPVKILKNIETGEEHIVLAYKKRDTWYEVTVPKEVTSSKARIVGLAKYGVNVTSESAGALVEYLSEIETLNEYRIKVQHSTSKFGWHGDEFLPYDNESIKFDSDSKFKALSESITEFGDFDVWKEHIIKLRASNKIEIKFMLSASFSSILVPIVGALSYFVDLNGETEGGKTVTLMVAASVWGNPVNGEYIGDFASTDTALEARAGALNNLPMILDDTSKCSKEVREKFEYVIYNLCSGKGKSRSDKNIALRTENNWKLCTLTSGEKPLSSFATQGGAINRIIEIKCSDYIFADPQDTAETMKYNYGFAGKKFVEIVKQVGADEIKRIYNKLYKQLADESKMQKQTSSIALVLTADYLIDKYIFNDGNTISINEAKEFMVEREAVSDGARCHQYILDKVAGNKYRFEKQTDNSPRYEQWGEIYTDSDGMTYAVFRQVSLTELCAAGGYKKPQYIEWLKKHDKIKVSPSGKPIVTHNWGDGTKNKGHHILIIEDDFIEADEELDDVPFE